MTRTAARLLVDCLVELGLDMKGPPCRTLRVAKARGITVSEIKTEKGNDLPSGITLTITTEERNRSITGTLFAGREPRIVTFECVPVVDALTGHMLYLRFVEKPGLIGGV